MAYILLGYIMPSPRILLLSDLHLEMHDYTPVQQGYDLVVLAGDIHTKERGVLWARKHFTVPVVYVPGNHEGYQTHWENNLQKMRELAHGTNVHVLEKNELVIDGVRFLGATGWASFDFWPNRQEAMYEAGRGRDPYSSGARDYRFIRTKGYRRLQPSDTALWALQTKNWLKEKLDEPFLGKTIVVTHHAPSAKSLKHGVQHVLDATEGSHWDDLVQHDCVDAWFHGHTHHSVDYTIGRTRVCSNPRGYPSEETGFREDFVLNWNSATPKPKL